MSTLREKLLLVIYDQFEQWLALQGLEWACHKGCATCCTQDVTMTAVEGDLIHASINDSGRHSWFAEKLRVERPRQTALETINEFAGKCLAGEEAVDAGRHPGRAEICPYLADDICQIYEVRPFACRSFASTTPCQVGQTAQQPQYYASASTAAQQLIEHVGQGEYWGNMHDVLLALCDLPANGKSAELLPSASVADQARARLRRAKPIPGFLIAEDEYDQVSPFIMAVFNTKIGEKTVEDILNGT